MMRAGLLRNRLELQTATQTRDAHGGVVESWATDATIWAQVTPLGELEINEADRMRSVLRHEVRIRYRTGVTSAKRFLWGSRVLNIDGIVNDDSRNRELIVQCSEVTS